MLDPLKELDRWCPWRAEAAKPGEKVVRQGGRLWIEGVDGALRPARHGDFKKVPHTPTSRKAKINDSTTWSSYEECARAVESGRFDGLGFVLGPDCDIAAIDLDNCRDPDSGAEHPLVDVMIHRSGSYAEFSPTGSGVHIIGVKGKLGAGLPPNMPFSAMPDAAEGPFQCDQFPHATVERFGDTPRFLCVTGDRHPGSYDELADLDDVLRYLFRPGPRGNGARRATNGTDPGQPGGVGGLQELLDHINPVGQHYDDWLKVGMALHHETEGSDEGLDLWREWSRKDTEKFKEQEFVGRWRSFRGGGSRGLAARGTLVRMARAGGWRPQGGYAGLICNAHGKPRPLLANAMAVLSQALEGALAYDEMSLRTIMAARPPWDEHAGDWTVRAWTPHDDALACEWMQHQGIEVGLNVVQEAVEAVAQGHPTHPVRDYLKGLEWDGEKRIDGWLCTHLGAEPSPYVEAIGARFIISAVARAMQPGVQVDNMLVLEGAQGIGKSRAVRALADPWFTDEIADFGSKDASMQLQGVWIAELSELGAMGRADIDRVKAFLSRSTDRFRPPYGRRVIEAPRQAVFVGTTNAEGYLKDETGGRRFWPVRVGRIDLDRLRQDRDQLWAEAHHRYEQGDPWWLDTPELVRQAAEEQGDRYASDPWHDQVCSFIAKRESVSMVEVLAMLGIETGRRTQSDQNRIARILQSLKWTKRRVRMGKETPWRYFPPDAALFEEASEGSSRG